MRWRIGSRTERQKHQRPKDQHVREGNDVKRFRIQDVCRGDPGTEGSSQRVRGRGNTQDDHQAREAKSRQPQFAMHVHAIRRHQGRLRDQQQNPRGERGPVQMNEPVGQRGPKCSRQEVAARKSQKHRRQHQQRQSRKKVVVQAGRPRLEHGGRHHSSRSLGAFAIF